MVRDIASTSSVAKGPIAEVILDAAPQAVESSRFEQQEHHDHDADRSDLERGKVIGEKPRSVAERIGGTSMSRAAPKMEPAMLPSPPTMIMPRYWTETSSVKRSQVTISV